MTDVEIIFVFVFLAVSLLNGKKKKIMVMLCKNNWLTSTQKQEN